jgi:hydrogenase maturation protein HypF
MSAAADGVARRHIRVTGIVQGVGFRPFVYSLAQRMRLAGHVGNDVAGVFIEVEGIGPRIDEFLAALTAQAPPLARIESIAVTDRPPTGGSGFRIATSDLAGVRTTLISADSATCADCLREMADPADRRYRYPFINCTNCGPRFTIVRDVPYDRPYTTMAGFAMCARCAAEYHDPADRRFHAQPVCCPDCGPRLRLIDPDGRVPGTDPIKATAAHLAAGKVVAIKGLGGFHLAVVASLAKAAATLRSRKHREDKPFALMAADVAAARALGQVTPTEEALLTDRARPIVLLDRHPDAAVAEAVAPGNRQLGVMLPYTPVHTMLLEALGEPIVLTSGNASDEPIAFHNADARSRLTGIADAWLTHDRGIHMRADDSVVRTFRGAPIPLRRSRGYAPEPIRLSTPVRRHILGCGAELKNTFCVAKDDHAFVSQHIGDLENYPTMRSYVEGIEHYCRLFDVRPTVVAHDLHPEYLSTKYALDLAGVEPIGVQHHHAHIASCLADNGFSEPVIGVAFDGTGFGPDGTIWGGEFLVADLSGYRRRGHLAAVPLPGGAAAIRRPWRMAAAYLDVAYCGAPPANVAVLARNDTWPHVVAMARAGMNSPLTSSAGRLFDAVAALLGVRDTITYEGQAAIELEQHADPTERGTYPLSIDHGETLVLQGADLVRAVVDDLAAGVPAAIIAARVHNGLADSIVRACELIRDETALITVALSGGVFQNQLLLARTCDGLAQRAFTVLTHRQVPPNDGGISLGQVAVAAAAL